MWSMLVIMSFLLIPISPLQHVRQQTSQGSDTCLDLNQAGMQAYQQDRITEAIENFTAALTCMREVGDRAGEGSILNNLAAMYRLLGRYDEALETYEFALQIRREVGDQRGEITTLNNIALVYLYQARYDEALSIYEKILPLLHEAGDQAGEAIVLNNIGGVYRELGQYTEALDNYKAALALRQSIGDQAGEGQSLNNIGEVYLSTGRYPQALEAFDAALTIATELGDESSQQMVLANLASLAHAQGRYADALDAFARALEFSQALGDRYSEGTLLANIAAVYDSQGRYLESIQTTQQALSINQEIGDRAGEADNLNALAKSYDAQGDYNTALAFYQRALAIQRELDNRSAEAVTLNNIATVYRAQGHYDEALSLYNRVLSLHQEIGDRSSEGVVLNNLGTVYEAQERYPEALQFYQESLAIRRNVGDRAGEGTTLNNIATIYRAQGNYSAAHEFYTDALAIRREVGDRASEATTLNNLGLLYAVQSQYQEALTTYEAALDVRRAVDDRVGEGITLNNMARVYEAQQRNSEALAHFIQAIDAFEAVRTLAGNDLSRSAFIAQYTIAYNNAQQLALRQGKLADAFFLSERGRARAFLDNLATKQVDFADNPIATLIAQEQAAYSTRQAAQTALTRARVQTPLDSALIAALEAQVADAEQAYQAALAAFDARQTQLADLVPGRSHLLQPPEIQNFLDDKTTLVAYWMLPDKTLAYILTSTDPVKLVELPDATPPKVAQALNSLYKWTNLDQPYPRPLRDLYGWLIAPLSNRIKTEQVILVPHQLLHYIPFIALTDGTTYLGQQHTLSISPSANALSFLIGNAQHTQEQTLAQAIIFGNPATSATELPPLLYAASEAEAVAKLIPTSAYIGSAASEQRLHTMVNGMRILHLAAHGEFDTTNPFSSAIFLAPEGEYDGRLETYEMFGLPLQGNDLVVLSACETNIGELSTGDEVVGMTRALFFAGAPTVVSSLWSVNDAATETLMVSFYKHWLQDGMSKAQALQAAQADVRTDPRWASPFYWAGFVLNGHPGQSR